MVQDPLGKITTRTFNGSGQQVSTTDPLGHTSSVVINSFGETVKPVDETNIRQTAAANIGVGGIQPAQTTTMTYNQRGLRTSTTSPEGRVTSDEWRNLGGIAMALTLDRAVEASEIVDALKPFGVTQVDIAAVTHVSDRAVRGWRSGDIHPDRYDRLAQLRDLALLLSDSLSPRGVGQWLHAKNRLLEGKRPVDLLADDRYDEVHGAAEAFIDGAYV